MSQIGGQTARTLGEYGSGPNPQELLTNGILVAALGGLAFTDRWYAHGPISVLCFLGIGWSTLVAILGL